MTLLISQFRFFDPEAELSIIEGHLPHWEIAGVTYFITYRLSDSLPTAALDRIETERQSWLGTRGIKSSNLDWKQDIKSLCPADFAEYKRLIADHYESELDRLHGKCILRTPSVARIVDESLKVFDGIRYKLGAFVVMPNHVHVLVCFNKDWSMVRQCYGWKHFQARKINDLRRSSGHVFQAESFDHIVRDELHLLKFRDYIAKNPLKAGLKESEYILYLPEIVMNS